MVIVSGQITIIPKPEWGIPLLNDIFRWPRRVGQYNLPRMYFVSQTVSQIALQASMRLFRATSRCQDYEGRAELHIQTLSSYDFCTPNAGEVSISIRTQQKKPRLEVHFSKSILRRIWVTRRVKWTNSIYGLYCQMLFQARLEFVLQV